MKLTLALDIAFLKYIQDSYLAEILSDLEEKKDETKKNYYRYYFDAFAHLKLQLTAILESLLGKPISIGPVRHKSDKYVKGQWYPDKITESLDEELPYDFFAKFIEEMNKLRRIIRENQLKKPPQKPSLSDEFLRRTRWIPQRICIALTFLFTTRFIIYVPDTPPEPRVPNTPVSVKVTGSNDTYGSSAVTTKTHYRTNQIDLENPTRHDNRVVKQLEITARLQLPGILTDEMWRGIKGLGPKTIRLKGKDQFVTMKDIVLYKRWFYSIKQDQTVLTKVQEIGFEAAIVVFQKGHGLKGDGDWAGDCDKKFAELVEKLSENTLYLLQNPNILNDSMGEGSMQARKILKKIDPFSPHPLNQKEKEAVTDAIKAVQLSQDFEPTGELTPQESARLKERFKDSVLPQRPTINLSPTSKGVPSQNKEYKDATKGGIDFNANLLDLQIRRDDNGKPLPLIEQPVADMKIDGFSPIIINITPINSSFILNSLNNPAAP